MMEESPAQTMEAKPTVRLSNVHNDKRYAKTIAHQSSGLLRRLWVLFTRYAHRTSRTHVH